MQSCTKSKDIEEGTCWEGKKGGWQEREGMRWSKERRELGSKYSLYTYKIVKEYNFKDRKEKNRKLY